MKIEVKKSDTDKNVYVARVRGKDGRWWSEIGNSIPEAIGNLVLFVFDYERNKETKQITSVDLDDKVLDV